MKIEKGMVVRYDHKWCRPEERHCLMVVIEVWEDVERCIISNLYTLSVLGSTERVDFEMIQPIGLNVDEYIDFIKELHKIGVVDNEIKSMDAENFEKLYKSFNEGAKLEIVDEDIADYVFNSHRGIKVL